jgi:chromosome segregation ATPase
MAMIAALGALATALLFLALLPFVNRRAQRLAMRKLEWRLPSTPAEIGAERDRLRAEIAVRERVAEQRIEAAKTARLSDQAETGRKLVDLHARAEQIALLDQTISENRSEILRLGDENDTRRLKISELEATVVAADARQIAMSSINQNVTLDLEAANRALAERRLEIDTLETARQSQMLRIGDAESDIRRLQDKLSEKTDESRKLDRSLRDAQSTLETTTKARERADHQSAERLAALRTNEEALKTALAERDQRTRALALESKTRKGLEDEIERRASHAAQIENELASVRRAGVQTTTELAMRMGELSSERQTRKSAEQALREAERKLQAMEKRAATAAQAREGSESVRITAVEKELKQAVAREAEAQKQLDRTRREAQETARDLSRTIDQLRLKASAPEPRKTAAKLPAVTLSIDNMVPPPASNDSPPANQADPQSAIAEMRARLRRKLDSETPPADTLREPRREADLRALPPGE